MVLTHIYSLSHTDNRKNNFLIIGKGPTIGINGSFGSPDKEFSLNFIKARTNFCLSLNYNGDNSYLFVNEKEIFKFKASNGSVNFPTWFYLGSICDGFHATVSREESLGGNEYDFSVNYNAIDKSDILDTYKYLIGKNSLSSIISASNHKKCVSLSSRKCMTQPILINLHPNEYSR